MEFSDQAAKELEEMLENTEAKTLPELINSSLTLLQWAVAEENSGRSIGSVDTLNKSYEYIRMPILDAIRQKLDDKKNKRPSLKVVK
jgi:hypothetical protein